MCFGRLLTSLRDAKSDSVNMYKVFFFFIQNVRKCKVCLVFMLSHAEPEIVPFVYFIELVDVNMAVFYRNKFSFLKEGLHS